MKTLIRLLFVGISLSIVLTACNFNTPDRTPTAEGIVEEPINPLPDAETPEQTPTITATLSPTPSLTPVALVQLVSETPTSTPGTPTATFTPEPTEGPWEYVVQSGETMGFILRQAPHNYDIFSNPAILDAVLALNGLSSANNVFAGQTLLIPRPTPTPIPQGIELTQAVIEAQGGDPSLGLGNSVIAPGTLFGCHEVVDGQTIIEIISLYPPLTFESICQLNTDNISCFRCDFEQPGGGPGCSVFLSVGQCVTVPLPTLTPTLSPTPNGNETPTATPTYRAPPLTSPPDGGLAPAGLIELQWVSVGQLDENEYYLVEITDITAGTAPQRFTTRTTSYLLPASLIPTDGQTHQFAWTVSVAVQNQSGAFARVGGTSQTRNFQWQSR